MPAIVYSYAESVDVADSVAKYVLDIQDEVLAREGVFKLAVSGGSLGKVLKKGLIDNVSVKDRVQWAKWEVYFSDERIVPLNHPDSNYGLFNEMVLQYLSGDKPKVFAIDESLVVGTDGQVVEGSEQKDIQLAQQYADIIPESFDLILLGCGPDGHTCSLFPGHSLLDETTKTIAHITDSPKPPPRRITVTFPVLAKAAKIAFVAEGAGKASILKEIFDDAGSQLPSKLVNDLDVPVVWFVDDQALHGVGVIPSKY